MLTQFMLETMRGVVDVGRSWLQQECGRHYWHSCRDMVWIRPILPLLRADRQVNRSSDCRIITFPFPRRHPIQFSAIECTYKSNYLIFPDQCCTDTQNSLTKVRWEWIAAIWRVYFFNISTFSKRYIQIILKSLLKFFSAIKLERFFKGFLHFVWLFRKNKITFPLSFFLSFLFEA